MLTQLLQSIVPHLLSKNQISSSLSSSVTSRPVFVSTTSGVAHASAIAASELITVGRGLLSQITSSNDTSGKKVEEMIKHH